MTPFGLAALKIQRGDDRRVSRLPSDVLFGLFLLVLLLVLVGRKGQVSVSDFRTLSDARIAAGLLVAIPFFVCATLARALIQRGEKRMAFDLCVRALPSGWTGLTDTVMYTWGYERERFTRSLHRIRLSAYQFGGLATLILACCLLGYEWRVGDAFVQSGTFTCFAIALSIATVSAFGLGFGRIMVRVANQDYNSRMFACATRSLFLVALSTTGLFVVLRKASPTGGWINTTGAAVLLGIFAALLGEKALPVLLEKAGTAFGIAVPPRGGKSLLTEIDGVTEDDVERFAEEGVVSLHDLAFVPTARLFFNTHHSLQRICDWQDQALLAVYVGSARAKTLAQQMGIRGAIDLQGVARDVLGPSEPYPPSGPADIGIPEVAPESRKDLLCQALEKALGMERAAILAFLGTVYADEATLRVRVHWQGTPIVTPTQESATGQTASGLAR